MKSNRLSVFSSLLLFIGLLSLPAQAGLILNGSFEQNDVASGKWKWYTADKVEGWNGSNIEIWDDLFRFSSFDGDQHIELNSHGSRSADPFSIFQTFDTVAGQQYQLSFAYSARNNSNEAFSVMISDQQDSQILYEIIDDHTRRNWSLYDNTFVATSNETTLRFTSITPTTRTVGNLLDAVEVKAVSEPATWLLFSSALLLLWRRQSQAS